ncbi:hypothetical protein GUJ93_ZPchr0010g8470 [Zizania palustris]|uniref:Uncharacterized protein n=1 Tax=Zizania palustris TaxID=103762 RepID=A0A8J6BP30_ZIZPA|nr:hypothetical protein GUJ93_ZPchr0010g8470 [Zizania palustris]
MMALDVLSSAVPPEMVSAVASKDTTREAWDVIKAMRVGDDRVCASMAQALLRQFETTSFKEGESIEDYSMRLSSMVQQLATLGEKVDEAKVVGEFLQSAPHRYKQIVLAIQTLLDVDTHTLANVTGRLKSAEELEAPPPTVNHASKLYLSEEAWEEKWKLCASEKSTGGGPGGHGGGGNRGRGGRRRRGRGDGRGKDGNGYPKPETRWVFTLLGYIYG